MNRTNFAPTARTIIVALVLIVVGLLGTYGLRYETTDPAVVLPQEDGDLLVMHRDLAVPPSCCNDTLGQQGDPDARGHTAQNRIDRTEFQGLCNEYSSLAQQIVQPYSI